MRTEVICCVKTCGKHLRWIDTPCGGVSSGYCKKHYEEAMREVEADMRWLDEEETANYCIGDDPEH